MRDRERVTSVRLSEDVLFQVEGRAEMAGKAVSRYLGDLVTKAITESAKPDLPELIELLEAARLRAVGSQQRLADVAAAALDELGARIEAERAAHNKEPE